MEIIEYIDLELLKTFPNMITCMVLFYLTLKVLDYITGLLKTWKGVVKYSSSFMRDSIIIWVGEMVAIVLVFGIDKIFGLNYYLTGFTLGLFIYKEVLSIIENLDIIGVQLPDIVREKIELLFKSNKGGK